ncbi:MAG: hypothetical protein HC927_04935 [Deltaproteobacteria bacterium]|nr:hypothetical protein [Deltaproteobacteria bacterium]
MIGSTRMPRVRIETNAGESVTLVDVTASEAVVQGLAQRRFRLRRSKPEDVP